MTAAAERETDRAVSIAPADVSSPARRSRVAHVLMALLASLALAGGSLWLFTRANDFPLDYHPDEYTKVEQILSPQQERNFHHPLLMIEADNLVRQVAAPEVRDGRQIAILGRWTSAGFAAMAVFCLALTAYVGSGWVGLSIVGATIALCPPLLVYAHYLKEDAALIGGLAVAILGMRLVLAARAPLPQLAAAIVLGIGCAMAASAKFVGVVAVLPAMIALLIAPLRRWWQLPARLGLFAVLALVVTVGINLRAFDDPWALQTSARFDSELDGEIQHATIGHYGLALTTPNSFPLRVTASELMPHVWMFAAMALLALAVGGIVRRRWLVTRFGVVTGLSIAAWTIVLVYNVIPIKRYALPLTVLGYFSAGSLVAAAIASWQPASRGAALVRYAVLFACVATIVIAQGTRCVAFNRQFADDSRQRLREWLAANVKPGEFVVADWYANAATAGDPWRFPVQSRPRAQIQSDGFASSRGPVSRLWGDGVRYVVICEPSYERFLIPGIKSTSGSDDWLKRQQAFYRDLETQADLVWSAEPKPPSDAYVHPYIRVFRVRPTGTPSQPTPREKLTPFERWLRWQARQRNAG